LGKRSDFARVDRDAYNTPLSAALPLLRVLPEKTRFIEPCAGDGDLIDHLIAAGHVLVSKWDLPCDAQVARYNVAQADCFITNPPFHGQRDDLHALIENLARQTPAWLLMPGDWLHNKSSAPLMPRLKTIVSVGRIRWIVGSESTSKDNYIWCLFGAPGDPAARCIGRFPDLPFETGIAA
jgi:hypothetical protein